MTQFTKIYFSNVVVQVGSLTQYPFFLPTSFCIYINLVAKGAPKHFFGPRALAYRIACPLPYFDDANSIVADPGH
jgi:hypothetical protein